jgi:hypothetical protein
MSNVAYLNEDNIQEHVNEHMENPFTNVIIYDAYIDSTWVLTLEPFSNAKCIVFKQCGFTPGMPLFFSTNHPNIIFSECEEDDCDEPISTCTIPEINGFLYGQITPELTEESTEFDEQFARELAEQEKLIEADAQLARELAEQFA